MTGAAPRPLALVTGASSGIGAALALELAINGYDLALAARSAGALETVAEDCRALGAAAHVFPADLCAPDGPAKLMAALSAQGLQIELLVNNAGFGDLAPFRDAPPGKLLVMVDLNIRALTALCHAALPGLIARGRGGILNVASTAGFQPGPGMAVYYASKAYVLSLSEALHHELKPHGLTVTALCPGPVQTGFQAAAGMEGAGLMKLPLVSAAEAARVGVKGFLRRKRIAVPGWPYKLLAVTRGISPRWLTFLILDRLQGGGR